MVVPHNDFLGRSAFIPTLSSPLSRLRELQGSTGLPTFSWYLHSPGLLVWSNISVRLRFGSDIDNPRIQFLVVKPFESVVQ